MGLGLLELFIIAVGLSMDAFAVAVCQGLSMKQVNLRRAAVVGLYFGLFQGLMPLIGFFCASYFTGYIEEFDHWVAFILLSVIGSNMVKEGLSARKDEGGFEDVPASVSLGFGKMLPLALATSIDALAMGITFAVMKVDIGSAVTFIGLTTFLLSLVGVYIGNIFGVKYERKAELAGGIILILMGLKILLEHIGVI